MSNIDKAAWILARWLPQCDMHGQLTTATHAAKALADAGLLAPELPGESWPQVWEVGGFLVTAIENGGETIELAEHEGDGTIGYGWGMNRHLARKLAYALLAAADYAEGQALGSSGNE